MVSKTTTITQRRSPAQKTAAAPQEQERPKPKPQLNQRRLQPPAPMYTNTKAVVADPVTKNKTTGWLFVTRVRRAMQNNRRAMTAVIAVLFLFVLVLTHQNEMSGGASANDNNNSGYKNYVRSMGILSGSHQQQELSQLTAAQASMARTSTTSIVEHNDPDLHKTATVMAASNGGETLDGYSRFVGSLRKTGFLGTIILVVDPDIPEDHEAYLESKNVVLHKAQYTACTRYKAETEPQQDVVTTTTTTTCVRPYPDLKKQWGKLSILKDRLADCEACTGPVLIAETDSFFQRNPFGPDAPRVHGLQVFEEHHNSRTTHWSFAVPVKNCRGVHYDEPLLASMATIGSRQTVLEYLGVFHREATYWMKSPETCWTDIPKDEKAIHNYLYYSGQLDAVIDGGGGGGGVVQAVKNRNGLVNAVGHMGSLIFDTHIAQKKILRDAKKDPKLAVQDAHHDPYDLSSGEENNNNNNNNNTTTTATNNWLGLHYGMTDRDGYFTDFDGSRSFVVLQYYHFGNKLIYWMNDHKEEIYSP